MTTSDQVHVDWRCHLGRHHFIGVPDDNPEMRGEFHLECTRCGKWKDIDGYGAVPAGIVKRGQREE